MKNYQGFANNKINMNEITIGRFIEWINKNNIPLNTEIDALVGNYPCTLKRIVYCKDYGTITMNPMGTHLADDAFAGKITEVLDLKQKK